jgi:hypothetical protein
MAVRQSIDKFMILREKLSGLGYNRALQKPAQPKALH